MVDMLCAHFWQLKQQRCQDSQSQQRDRQDTNKDQVRRLSSPTFHRYLYFVRNHRPQLRKCVLLLALSSLNHDYQTGSLLYGLPTSFLDQDFSLLHQALYLHIFYFYHVNQVESHARGVYVVEVGNSMLVQKVTLVTYEIASTCFPHLQNEINHLARYIPKRHSIP